jgi:hypothetical protein
LGKALGDDDSGWVDSYPWYSRQVSA